VWAILILFFPRFVLAREPIVDPEGQQVTEVGACPETQKGWLTLRSKVRGLKKITDILAFGFLAETCSSQLRQEKIFERSKFNGIY
jgi:hypothetical protein